MKRYLVLWSPNETDSQPPLETKSTGMKLVYSFSSKNMKEAEKVYQEELAMTSLTRVDDLDYEMSEEELRKHATTLQLIMIETSDHYAEIFDSSDYYCCINNNV